MALELPADLELFVGTAWDTPAVYCLRLSLPADLPERWDAEYDTRPDYVNPAATARQVLYVGATGDVLSRLEDHRDGEVREVALVGFAEDVDVRNVWPFDSAARAFERESGIALALESESSERVYVHQR